MTPGVSVFNSTLLLMSSPPPSPDQAYAAQSLDRLKQEGKKGQAFNNSLLAVKAGDVDKLPDDRKNSIAAVPLGAGT